MKKNNQSFPEIKEIVKGLGFRIDEKDGLCYLTGRDGQYWAKGKPAPKELARVNGCTPHDVYEGLKRVGLIK